MIAVQAAEVPHEYVEMQDVFFPEKIIDNAHKVKVKPQWFLDLNPNGAVPTFDTEEGGVYESLVCNEYIAEKYPNGKKLVPQNLRLKAVMRIWTAWIGDNVVSPFYKLLMAQTEEEKATHGASLLKAIKTINDVMVQISPEGGLFFGNKHEGLCLFDIALLPFAHRIPVLLGHYRGFSVPETPEYARYHSWYKAAIPTKAFQATMIPNPAEYEKKLVSFYNFYANKN